MHKIINFIYKEIFPIYNTGIFNTQNKKIFRKITVLLTKVWTDQTKKLPQIKLENDYKTWMGEFFLIQQNPNTTGIDEMLWLSGAQNRQTLYIFMTFLRV